MYPLTEFSESKLRLLNELIGSRLLHERKCAEFNLIIPDDNIETVARLAAKLDATIKDLEDMRTWVLTALQMVTTEEKLQSN